MLVLLRGCVWVKVTNQATTTFTRLQELPFRTWKTTRLNGGSKCPVGFVSKNHHLIVMIDKLCISTTKLFLQNYSLSGIDRTSNQILGNANNTNPNNSTTGDTFTIH